MIILKIAIVTGTAVIALASAWSTHFLHDDNTNNVMFRGFASPSSPPPPPLQLPPFRSFFQDTVRLLPRGYYHVQPHEPFVHPMNPLHPYPAAPSSPPPPRTSALLRPAAPSQQVTDSVHHVHVFYYYYLPADVVERTPSPSRTGQRDGGPQDQGPPRKPCTDQQPDPTATTTTCPPSYLPPPPRPPPAPIATLPSPPPITEAPCDDTVVVDNAEYYPFGRGVSAPIVVADQYDAARHVKMSSGPPQDNARRPDLQPVDRRRPEHKSNFILANYLLPPDNKR